MDAMVADALTKSPTVARMKSGAKGGGGMLSTFLRRIADRVQRRRDDEFCTLNEAVISAEVKALIHYASERGLDPRGVILVPLYEAVVAYDCAVAGRDKAGVAAAGKEILRHYCALSQITYADGVNGRTLQDARRVGRFMKTIIVGGVLALACGVFAELLPMFAGWLSSVDNGLARFLLVVHEQKVLVYLSPFFWGALGSCVYLLKTLSEKAAAHTFDSRKLQGTGARIFLGATFAGIVVNSLGLQAVTVNGETGVFTTTLTSSAVAFICGLGVKAVYGAFERVVETIHDRISRIGTQGQTANASGSARSVILERLAETPADSEPEKHKLLSQLLSDLSRARVAA